MANDRGHYGTSWIGQARAQRAFPDPTPRHLCGTPYPEGALFRWPWLLGAVLLGGVVLNAINRPKQLRQSADFAREARANWERHHPGQKYPYA